MKRATTSLPVPDSPSSSDGRVGRTRPASPGRSTSAPAPSDARHAAGAGRGSDPAQPAEPHARIEPRGPRTSVRARSKPATASKRRRPARGCRQRRRPTVLVLHLYHGSCSPRRRAMRRSGDEWLNRRPSPTFEARPSTWHRFMAAQWLTLSAPESGAPKGWEPEVRKTGFVPESGPPMCPGDRRAGKGRPAARTGNPGRQRSSCRRSTTSCASWPGRASRASRPG